MTYVRPHLEYAAPAWNPYRKRDEKLIENIQRRATKLAPSPKRLSYYDRLEKLRLTTLKKRRGDAIQNFKITKGLNKVEYVVPNRVAPAINSTGPAASIRGHAHRRERQAVKGCDQREFFFSIRIVSVWNSLPKQINKTNEFKNLLDKFDKKKGRNKNIK